jgi:hypothetical protein
VMVSNLLHVSGWQVSIGLFHGCCRVLKTGGLLLIYGPFKRGGTYNADSNKKFDEFLKSRNPEVSLFFCLFQRMGGENHFLVWFKGYR